MVLQEEHGPEIRSGSEFKPSHPSCGHPGTVLGASVSLSIGSVLKSPLHGGGKRTQCVSGKAHYLSMKRCEVLSTE